MFGKLKDITCSINKISLERRCSFHECIRQCSSLKSKASITAPRSFHSLPVARPSSILRDIAKIKSNPHSFASHKYRHHQNNAENDKWNSKLHGIFGENYILISRRHIHDWKNGAYKRGPIKRPITERNVFSFHTDNCLNMEQNITNGKDTMAVSDRIYRKDVENASLPGPQSRELNGIRHKKFQSNSMTKENTTQKVWNSKSFDSNSKVINDLTKLGDSFERRDENTTIQNRISQIQDTTGFLPPNKILSNLIVYEKQKRPKNYLNDKNLQQTNTKSQQQVFDTKANKFSSTVFGQTAKKGTFNVQVHRKSIQLSDDNQWSNLSKTLDLGQSESQRKRINFVDLRNINVTNKNIPSQGSNFAGARLKVSPQDSPRNFHNKHEPTTTNQSPPTLPFNTTGQSQAQTMNEIVKSNQDESERESLRDENNEIRQFTPINNFYGKTQKDSTKQQWHDKNDVEKVLSAILRKNKLKQMYVDSSDKIQYTKNNRTEVRRPLKNDSVRGERKKQLLNYVLKQRAGRYVDSTLTFSHKSFCLSDIERYKQSKLLERHRAMKTIYDAHWEWDKAGSLEVFDKPLIATSDGKRREPYKLRPADIAEKIRLKAKIVNSKELNDETIKPQLYCKNTLAFGMMQMPIAPCTRVVNRQRGHRVKKQPKSRTSQMTKSIIKHRTLGSFFKNSNPLWTNQRMLSNHGDQSQRNSPKGKPKIDIKGALKYLLDFKSRLSMSKD